MRASATESDDVAGPRARWDIQVCTRRKLEDAQGSDTAGAAAGGQGLVGAGAVVSEDLGGALSHEQRPVVVEPLRAQASRGLRGVLCATSSPSCRSCAYDLRNTRVYAGPVAGSVLLHGCADACEFHLCARQVRIHDATNGTSFYVRTASGLIIEHSSDVRFAPYALGYPGIDEAMEKAGFGGADSGTWREVEDFGWIKQVASPNWRILAESEGPALEAAFDGRDVITSTLLTSTIILTSHHSLIVARHAGGDALSASVRLKSRSGVRLHPVSRARRSSGVCLSESHDRSLDGLLLCSRDLEPDLLLLLTSTRS